jgi:hypothetical protein
MTLSAGAVQAVSAIDTNPAGRPASARISADSKPSGSCPSSAKVQISDERGGRSGRVVSSPATTLALHRSHSETSWRRTLDHELPISTPPWNSAARETWP